MKKLLLVPVIGAIATLTVAAASQLDVTGGNEQAGTLTEAELSCDTDGVTIVFGNELDDLTAHFVRVEGIATGCAGSTLLVKVFDTNGNGMTGNLSWVIAAVNSPNLSDANFPLSIEDIGSVNVIIEK